MSTLNFLHNLQLSSQSFAVKVTFVLNNFNFSHITSPSSSHCSFWHSLSLICNDAGNYKPQCNLSTMQEWCWIFHSDSLKRLDNGKSTWMGWSNQFVTDLGSFFFFTLMQSFSLPNCQFGAWAKGHEVNFSQFTQPACLFFPLTITNRDDSDDDLGFRCCKL